ncbi:MULTISPECIES: SCO1860 family LAETG-anchored protein [Streptomyces]|nr:MULTISPECIES: SCO1860 family LAETG-anchored protein [Streptomyces]KOU64319.1 LPXTG-motif cell wall anchor domain protein [Streptomyces sp. IGB124]KOU73998.1 LPXTG-motif cell wall anchor domain protein [Streptomyces sp. XY66]KOU86207.1 LPXTG-motif cell wall anchor domain protein [Streptomyces sp. XY58]KOV06766.1 LPXTG-motif cell wall anchor domain protein [Streptomyces sp. XY37]KOV26675.1 LPXTG-motif cell wall anchor domain protein [Streptomyces sp. XY413]
MNSNTFRMPAAALLATGAVALLTAPPASATGGTPAGGEGKSGAVVLRTGLDVGLLNTVHIPMKATLNEVSAPATAEKTALTVTLDGVEGNQPVSVLRADVATSKATADKAGAQAEANLAKARVHVPGLPLLSLIEVEKVTSKAVCEAGKKPVASANVLGTVTVLGKKATLSAGGPTKVEVPGVGAVSLELSSTQTTSTTAAAAALRLKVALNPLNLNVAKVDGEIVLAEAHCESPTGPAPTTKAPGQPDIKTQTGTGTATTAGPGSVPGPTDANLAETGGGSLTPFITGGALTLLALGGGALFLTRRGKAQ